MQEIRVWDLLVRLLHCSLVLSVVGAWLTREGNELRHERLRVRALARGDVRLSQGGCCHREPRHIGHNPLGGWKIVMLLATIAVICGTGWLCTAEAYWGVAWVRELHEGATDVLIALVTLHVAGVVFTSTGQKENLVKAMTTGTKRRSEARDRFRLAKRIHRRTLTLNRSRGAPSNRKRR